MYYEREYVIIRSTDSCDNTEDDIKWVGCIIRLHQTFSNEFVSLVRVL